MATLTPQQSSVPPPPGLQLHLVIGCEEDLGEYSGDGSRRLSTSSLSRFRSCPQLASMMHTSHDSPCYDDMAPITDNEGNIIHTSPVVRNSLYVDAPVPESGGIRSAASTPTPPSTPGCRRKNQIVSPYNYTSHTQTDGAPSVSTSMLARQSRTDHIFGAKACSLDIQEGHMDDWIPPRNENLQRFDDLFVRDNGSLVNLPLDDFHEQFVDDERISDTDDGSSMHINGRFAHHSNRRFYQNYLHGGSGDDSVDKCSRWLQSLKLNKSDKIKSRSHIQLPAV